MSEKSRRGFTLRKTSSTPAVGESDDKPVRSPRKMSILPIDMAGRKASSASTRSPRVIAGSPTQKSMAGSPPKKAGSPRSEPASPRPCAALVVEVDVELEEGVREALEGPLMGAGGLPNRRHSRAAPSSDQLVAAASALLRLLKSARLDASKSAQGLGPLLSTLARATRQVVVQLGDEGVPHALSQRVVLLVQATAGPQGPPDLSRALEAAVEVALQVRQLKDRVQECAALEAHLEVLTDAVGNSSSMRSESSQPSVGVYEGLVGAIGDITKFLALGRRAGARLAGLSFVPLGEAVGVAIRLARLMGGAELEGRALMVAAHASALLRGKMSLAEHQPQNGGDEDEKELQVETGLRAKMLEAETAVAALIAAVSHVDDEAAASPAVAAAPPRSKGLTFRGGRPPVLDEDEAKPSWREVAPERVEAVTALRSLEEMLEGQVEAAAQLMDLWRQCPAPTVEKAATLEEAGGLMMAYWSSQGPLFSSEAMRRLQELRSALMEEDEPFVLTGLCLVAVSLSPARYAALRRLLHLFRALLAQPSTVWNAESLAGSWTAALCGSSDTPVFALLLERLPADPIAHLNAQDSGLRVVTSLSGVDEGVLSVTGATPAMVAQLLVREEYRLIEPRILEIVLLTHSLWTSSGQLLQALCDLYLQFRQPSKDAFRTLMRTRVQDVVGFWFMSPLYLRPDELTEEYVGIWQKFLSLLIGQGIREVEKTTFKKFTQLLSSHYTRLEEQAAMRSHEERQQQQQQQRREDGVGTGEEEAQMDAAGLQSRLALPQVVQLAEAITRVDSLHFGAVQPFELLGNAHLDPLKAPGFARMISQFNAINIWVQHSVLVPHSSDRAQLLAVFVLLAKQLWEAHDFHGSYAVLCGLSSSPVSRLQKSFRKLNKKAQKAFDDLLELNSHSKNYKAYRAHLKGVNPPLVPQMGIISRDLFGLEENNENYLDDEQDKDKINLGKSRLLEKVVFEVLGYQNNSTYPFPAASEEMATLVGFFKDLPDIIHANNLTEKSLYDRSLVLEPREQ